jgi:hypothetical protein
MADLNDKISHFISYGRDAVGQIMQLDGPNNAPLPIYEYRKLALAALIDGYSRYLYPRKGSRERYVAFVRQCGNWPNADRVSQTHLLALLRRSPEPEFDSLRAHVRENVAGWKSGDFIPLDRDPTLAGVCQRWPKAKDYREPLAGVKTERLTHASLLYAYRCSLAHEMKAPGFSWDVSDRDEPFYISGSDNLENGEWKERWMLVYPLALFRMLVLNCLSGLEAHLMASEIDPYELRKTGEFWIESLNT